MLENTIYTLRHNLTLSQAQLAAKCNVTQQFIQQIENGKRTPSLRTAKRIAQALGVTVDDLIKSDKIMSAHVSADADTMDGKGA